MLKRLLALGVILLAFGGCAPASGCGGGNEANRCIRILFIGNSYTQANDLPGMVAAIVRAGGFRVETAIAAEGGAGLADHLQSPAVLDRIAPGRWDFVVLQEQSQIPSIERFRQNEMYPAARRLVGIVVAARARPMFFMTWAHRDGWPENGLPNYQAMQSQIAAAYAAIAAELNVPVAPVGSAWSTVTRANPSVGLWQADGSHPTEGGTYLAACVFYATIFQKSPVGSTYVAGLPAATAQILQLAAAQTVLPNLRQWNLP